MSKIKLCQKSIYVTMGGELIRKGGYLLPISAHVWVMGRMGGLKTAELWGAWGVTPMAKARGGLRRRNPSPVRGPSCRHPYRCLGASQESFAKMFEVTKTTFSWHSAKKCQNSIICQKNLLSVPFGENRHC